MRFISPILIVTVLISSYSYAGGGSEVIDPFNNPLTSLHVEDQVSKRTLHSIMHELRAEEGLEFNEHGFSSDFDYLEELRTRIASHNRNVRIVVNAGNREYGCLNRLARYPVLVNLFDIGIDKPDLGLVNSDAWNGHIQARSVWRDVAYVYSECRGLESNSPKPPLIAGKPVMEFLKMYNTFIRTPSDEAAEYLVSEESENLVKRYTTSSNLRHYETIKHYAERHLLSNDGESGIGIVKLKGDFPIDRVTWDRCSNASAINGMYTLVDALSQDENLSSRVLADAIYYRLRIFSKCAGDDEPTLSAGRWSEIPTEWQNYLKGIAYFYDKQYLKAALEFDSAAHSDNAFLSEMGTYLAARGYHLAAQTQWSGWVQFDENAEIDTSFLLTSSDRFDAHIRMGGRFSYSAIGLKRRNAYLMGNREQYEALFEPSIEYILDRTDDPSADSRLFALFQEAHLQDFDLKFAHYLVEKSDRVFNHPSLSEMSSVVRFFNAVEAYRDGGKTEAVELFEATNFPAAAPYMVEEAQGRDDHERLKELYVRFLPESSQPRYLASLGYSSQGRSSFISEEHRTLTREFALSHCDVEELKRTFMDNLDNPGIEPVRDVLFNIYIQREKFVKLNELIVNEYIDNQDYEHIRTAVRQIVEGENLGTAYMNIGYYIDAVMGHPGYAGNTASFLSELDPELFCDSSLSSNYRNAHYFYAKSIAQFDESDRSVSEAKALHYAIQCDRVGRRGCWGPRPNDLPAAQTLFQRLNRKYPDSEWAERTPYYYD